MKIEPSVVNPLYSTLLYLTFVMRQFSIEMEGESIP